MTRKRDLDHSRQLLAAHMEKARTLLDRFLDTHGVSLTVLGNAMEEFTLTVFDLPKEAACQAGCAHCCHLKVGVSIPELLVIFYELEAQSTKEVLASFKGRMASILARGDTLRDAFWHESQTACPFLDTEGRCLIYALRPFSCRAYHSTNLEICRQGYEDKRAIQVPCFPLYRACTDMYSSAFIRVLADKGFFSYQVGFVKGLGILFHDASALERWLNKEDVFSAAAL